MLWAVNIEKYLKLDIRYVSAQIVAYKNTTLKATKINNSTKVSSPLKKLS